MSEPLITLETAKRHLRITDTYHDADVQRKLDQAQAAILRYLADYADPTWTEATVPMEVAAAIERYLTSLYEDRGDSMDTQQSLDEQVWASIRRLLTPLRDPSLGVPPAEVPSVA